MPGRVSEQPVAQMIFVPPGDWTPDVPSPTNRGFSQALNLVPQSNGLYGPERAPGTFFTQSTLPFGTALKVHGPLHSLPPAPGQAPRFYAGTFATGSGESRILSRLEQGAWSDLSRAGGYTIIASNPWAFCNFGTQVIAANRGIRTQISVGGAGTFADIANAPQFFDVATVAGFVMGINYVDNAFGNGSQPYGVAWSAIGNPNLPPSSEIPAGGWPDPRTDFAANVQSGVLNTLVGGGRLQRIIPGCGGNDAVIIASRKTWRVNFVGPPNVFQFDEVEVDQGTSAPQSIAAHNEILFMYGHNGFYFFDGQNMTPIGQGEIDNFFINDIDLASGFGLQAGIAAGIDAIEKNYVIAYRSVNQMSNSDNNDRILRFNWLTRKWSNSAQAMDAMGSLDNNFSKTDSPTFFSIGEDFQLQAVTGELAGAPLETTITMGESFDTSGAYSEIQGYLPLIDTDDVEVALRVRDQLSQTPIETTLRGLNQNGVVPFDIDNTTGRFYACRIRVPAGSEWTNFQGGLYEIFPHSRGPRSGSGNP